jgi:hypothetical protein
MLDLHHLEAMTASGALSKLSRQATHVYLTMLGTATPTGECHLSVNELAARIRGTWRTASGAVSELMAAGLIPANALSPTHLSYSIAGVTSAPTTEGSVPTAEASVPTTEAPAPLARVQPQDGVYTPYGPPRGTVLQVTHFEALPL